MSEDTKTNTGTPEEQAAHAAPLNLAQWAAMRYSQHVLPSGLGVKLRKMTILDLAASGNLPDGLTATVMGMFDSDAATPADANKVAQDVASKDLTGIMQMFTEVARACIVEPPTTTGITSAEELNPSDLTWEDKSYIFNYANEGLADLKPFRQ